MKIIKIMALIVIFICCMSTVSFAAPEYKSFVDEMVDDPRIFEEDRTDPFYREKREINNLMADGNLKDAYNKLEELENKLNEKFGHKFKELENAWNKNFGKHHDPEVYRARRKYWNIRDEKYIKDKFPYDISGYDKNELKQKLKNESTWQNLDPEILKHLNDKNRLELQFKIYRKFATVCKNTLGESDPITLKNTIKLIQYYSFFGDSKTALDMEKDLFPKIKKVFGEKSKEFVEVLNLMAKDYKVLGKYKESEKTLLRAIEINKNLYGEKSSPELLYNLVSLIKLKRTTSKSNPALYDSLEKAAKNIPEDDLYCLGYFRTKLLNKHLLFLLFNQADEKNAVRTSVQRSADLTLLNSEEDRALNKSLENEELNMRNLEFKFDWDRFIKAFNDKKFNGKIASSSSFNVLSGNYRDYLGNFHYNNLMLLCSLSDYYLRLNQSDFALSLSQEAFEKSKKIYGDEHPCTVYTIHSLTDVYRKIGRYSDALKLDKQAYELCKKIFTKSSAGEPLEILRAMQDIADDYVGLKNYVAAIKHYEDILSKDPLTINYVYNSEVARKNLACVYNLTGDYEKTVQLYDSFKAWGNLIYLYNPDAEYKEESLNKFYDFLKQDHYTYALYRLSASLITVQTADVLGEALTFVGKNREALDCYFMSIERCEDMLIANNASSIDSETVKTWFSDIIPYYQNAASFFITQQEFTKALAILECCKARALSNLFAGQLTMKKYGIDDDNIAKIKNYAEELSEYRNKFKDEWKNGSNSVKIYLNEIYHNIEGKYSLQKFETTFNFKKNVIESNNLNIKEFAKIYNDYFNILGSYNLSRYILYSGQLKNLIPPPNHCYITFSIVKEDSVPNKASDEILACVVQDDGSVNGFKIEVDENFFDNCNLYYETLSHPDSGKDPELINLCQKLSAQIGDTLLAPLSKFIVDKQTWIISPDGELNNIPFETLQFNGKPAVESANISYVPSFSVLKLMQDTKTKNDLIADRKEIFAMGNAVYGNNGYEESRGQRQELLNEIKNNPNNYFDLTKLKWDNLPGTEKELEQLSNIFSADSSEIITGFDASEKNLKQRDKEGQLAQYKYILFATHGMFIAEKPELSSIVLSQGLHDENYDGYVTVGEWFGYNLNSDLVYLSTCESGLGDYQIGEGIIGIPYALTVSGNKDTIMTLWKINDEAAAKFASTFFQKLKDGKSELQAINETKREFLKSDNPNLKNPAVWSAFVLYGL